MLSLARQEIGPIGPVLTALQPDADTSQMGSWGILYLICGAQAGQSLDWMATVFENIPTGHAVFQQWISGTPSEMDLAFAFKDLILDWVRDPAGLALTRSRLAHVERDRQTALSDKGRQQLLDYGRLAIMLNSLSTLETDEMAALRRWVVEHDQGWATLFFAAGILLSNETEFPWPSIGAGLLAASHRARGEVKSLFDRYAQHRGRRCA